MERPTCKTCVYFVDGEQSNVGTCHRFPPRNSSATIVKISDDGIEDEWGTMISEDEFPAVLSIEWCGEHPDFPEWVESQQKTEVKRPCRECGRETHYLEADSTGRVQSVCDRGHNNGWTWLYEIQTAAPI